MEAGLSGGRSPPVGWLTRSRGGGVVNGDARDERADHLRVEQVGERDWLVAVGAGSAEVDTAGEHGAVGAALLAEQALTAAGAFVNGDFATGVGGGCGDRG